MSAEYVVGPGVLQAMADHGDEPRSDELYIVNTDGRKISQTYGINGVYVWEEVENATRVLPFR
jgi:hypothetical protein